VIGCLRNAIIWIRLATGVNVGSKRDSFLYRKKGDQNRLYFLWACSMISISRALTILIFDFGNLPGVAMGDMWDGQKQLWDNEARCKVLRKMREEILLIPFLF